jgi:membrane associated rhomboid family serine protease
MFPYRDENPTVRQPIGTWVILAVTGAVWFLVQGAGFEPRLTTSVCELGAIPGNVFGQTVEPIMTRRGPVLPCPGSSGFAWHTVVTSIFLHGGWFHLISNMWFLWVFGDNVEDSMGRGRYAAFYLVCGVLAALAQMIVDPDSPVPLVGASGAISGVMGAYLVLYPKVRVHTLLFLGFFITRITVPAYLMLLYWAFIQIVGSLPSLAGQSSGGGVAFLAHLGGFVAGAALIKLFSKPEYLAAHRRYLSRVAMPRSWIA